MMRLLLFILLLAGSSVAQADCRVTNNNAAFGTQTSFTVNSTVLNTTSVVTLNCDKVLNLLNNDNVTFTLLNATSSTGTRAALRNTTNPASTDLIPIQLCVQTGCPAGSEIPLSGSYRFNAGVLLGLLNSQTYNFPLFIRTLSGQNVSAGLWQVNLTLRVNFNICAVGVAVCLTLQSGTVDITTQITLSVTNDCIAIAAPTINFNSAPLVKDFAPVSQSISITCTKGSVYTVGINNGLYPSGNVRNMASGANRLSYEIFKGSSINRWGVSGTERWASADSSQLSTDGLLRTYNYTARILATQNTPPAGNYSDTLVVDIAF